MSKDEKELEVKTEIKETDTEKGLTEPEETSVKAEETETKAEETETKAEETETEPTETKVDTEAVKVETETKVDTEAVKVETETVKVDTEAEPTETKVDTEAEPTETKVDTEAEPVETKVDTEAEPTETKVNTEAEPVETKVDTEVEPVESTEKKKSKRKRKKEKPKKEPDKASDNSDKQSNKSKGFLKKHFVAILILVIALAGLAVYLMPEKEMNKFQIEAYGKDFKHLESFSATRTGADEPTLKEAIDEGCFYLGYQARLQCEFDERIVEDDTIYYRYVQTYNGIPVDDRVFILEVDMKTKEIELLSTNALDVDNLDFSESISSNENLERIILNALAKKEGVGINNIENLKINSDKPLDTFKKYVTKKDGSLTLEYTPRVTYTVNFIDVEVEVHVDAVNNKVDDIKEIGRIATNIPD